MTHNDDDETHWMRAIANGNERAFAQLVERYGPVLIGYVRQYIHNEQDAEEIAQETLWRAWRQAAKWRADGPAKLSTWLFTVAHNLATDRWRRAKRNLEDGHAQLPEQATPDPSMEDQLSTRQQLSALYEGIEQLPTQQRQALYLVIHQHMSAVQVAQVLGCSQGAAEQLILRARRTLREKFRGNP